MDDTTSAIMDLDRYCTQHRYRWKIDRNAVSVFNNDHIKTEATVDASDLMSAIERLIRKAFHSNTT